MQEAQSSAPPPLIPQECSGCELLTRCLTRGIPGRWPSGDFLTTCYVCDSPMLSTEGGTGPKITMAKRAPKTCPGLFLTDIGICETCLRERRYAKGV